MTEKTQDVYKDEAVVAHMIEVYQAADSDEGRKLAVDELAAELKEHGKSRASVVQKLVTLKVYIKATPKTKAGKPIRSKSDLVGDIEEAMGVEVGTLETLDKANKAVLETILAHVLAKREDGEDEIEIEDEEDAEQTA